MLHIANKLQDLDIQKLMDLYDEYGENLPSYLREIFFSINGACYVIWVVDGQYRSALRMEPYQDGFLITGFQTQKRFRSMGYGKRLLKAAICYISNTTNKIYSHIHWRNLASQRAHSDCGFCKSSDSAVLLDGTVTNQYITMIYENRTD